MAVWEAEGGAALEGSGKDWSQSHRRPLQRRPHDPLQLLQPSILLPDRPDQLSLSCRWSRRRGRRQRRCDGRTTQLQRHAWVGLKEGVVGSSGPSPSTLSYVTPLYFCCAPPR